MKKFNPEAGGICTLRNGDKLTVESVFKSSCSVYPFIVTFSDKTKMSFGKRGDWATLEHKWDVVHYEPPKQGQSRLGSFIESCVNVAIGAGVAFLSQVVLFPIFDIHVNIETHLWLTTWFTVISVVRSHIVRRVFNRGFKNGK
jgi:hypothetical protein